MASNQPDLAQGVGGLDDSVRLVVGSDDLLVATGWNIAEEILSQPSAFSVAVGMSSPPGAFMRKYPKRTAVQLYIGSALQMTGQIDGYRVKGAAGTLTIKGRDALAPLHDGSSESPRSFIDGSYSDAVKWALKEAGLDPDRLVSSNAANRKINAGVPIDELDAPVTIDQVNQEQTSSSGTTSTVGATIKQEHQYKLSESLLTFVRRLLDRAGLFLWAAADGSFILSQPNGAQAPTYRLTRKLNDASNVIECDFNDDATHRHSAAVVYGRGGGRKAGRGKAKGAVIDEEMSNLGYTQAVLYRDVNVQNVEQAEFFARRKLAEERREGWSLSYPVSGHRLPAMSGGLPAVITPDTTAQIDDDYLDIHGVHYIEGVTRTRDPHTTSIVRLMRLNDLVFGNAGIVD
jgi:prophage tail gpP-like protein